MSSTTFIKVKTYQDLLRSKGLRFNMSGLLMLEDYVKHIIDAAIEDADIEADTVLRPRHIIKARHRVILQQEERSAKKK